MVAMMTQTAEANLAADISDYRFCAYGLGVLEHNPDKTSVVAVVKRMNRLATESPELRLLINEPHAHSREDFLELLPDHNEITPAIFSTPVKRFRKVVEQ